MSEAASIRVLVASRLRQADDALEAARMLVEAALYRDATNRAYYAIFYSVLALLVVRRVGASKHSGVLTLFSREFVKTGLLQPEMAKWAHRAFERRLEADYAELADVSRVEAEETLEQATLFLSRVKELLPGLIPEA